MSQSSHARAAARDPVAWHLLLLFLVSAGYESLFLHHGLNRYDESWPLYAAMQLRDGGALYRDVFFLFPPGHLLPAWIAQAWDPPGYVAARVVYAGFNVALCLAMYGIGRRLMPPRFALLGALMLALASPRGHLYQLLFGYRYFLFSALGLLAFSARLRTGRPAWMFWSGLAVGVGVVFRLSPPFAVSCGVAVAAACAAGSGRELRRDGALYAGGLLLATVPVLVWLWAVQGVAPDVVWREVVVRLMGLQSAQGAAFPALVWPDPWTRKEIYTAFVAVQYRLYPALLATYLVGLGVHGVRAVRSGGRFEHPLLLALVVTASIFFLRALGRSDEPHLDSALPPLCLLLAHAVSRAAARVGWVAGGRSLAVCAAALAAWIFLPGTDLYLSARERGTHRVKTAGEEIFIPWAAKAREIDRVVNVVRRFTRPGDTILNLSESPMFHVLSQRRGPGAFDVVMPGTFLDEADEQALLERVRARPPALVIWPEKPFDGMPSRGIESTAPLLAGWVKQHYVRPPGPQKRWIVLLPREAVQAPPS